MTMKFHPANAFKPFVFLRSPLAWRLLLVNLLAPVLLLAGLFYMAHYRQGLIDAEIKILKAQAELMALAVSEGAVNSEFTGTTPPFEIERTVQSGFFTEKTETLSFDDRFGRSGGLQEQAPLEVFRLIPDAARRVLQRLASVAQARVRLFDHNGVLTADNRLGQRPLGIPTEEFEHSFWGRELVERRKINHYDEPKNQTAFDYEEVGAALGDGVFTSKIRYLDGFGSILSVAVPVIFNDQIVGAIMVNGGIENVIQNLMTFRLGIFRLFMLALAVTVLLSYFMVGTIVAPLNRLSTAARNIRTSGGRLRRIPDETKRHDEIGDLSGALIKMTDTIWERLDATERFAADVSHEIKNPLSSMRSALETIDYISDPAKKQKLMTIVHDDVLRLDRLITDISNLSRLDAELSREIFEPVDIYKLLSSSVEVYNLGEAATKRGIKFILDWDESTPKNLYVLGMETRLAQVFYNLIGNAISFSPDNGHIVITGKLQGKSLILTFEDEGKGIPPGDEEKLFRRFYCERPQSEQFGHHSGLGLSISEKVVTGLNGTIYARNRTDASGKILGACFVVSLPVMQRAE